MDANGRVPEEEEMQIERGDAGGDVIGNVFRTVEPKKRNYKRSMFAVTITGKDLNGYSKEYFLDRVLEERCFISYILSKEHPIGGQEHYHFYLHSTVEKLYVEVRDLFVQSMLPGEVEIPDPLPFNVEVTGVHKLDRYINYITKQDMQCIYQGTNTSMFSMSWKIFHWCSGKSSFDYTDPFVLLHPTYLRVMERCFLDLRSKRVMSNITGNSGCFSNPQTALWNILEGTEHVYIHGPTRCGKSFVIDRFLAGNCRVFIPPSTTPTGFSFGNLNDDHTVIYLAEVSPNWLQFHRDVICRLIDRQPTSVDQKHAPSKIIKFTGRFIICSNFEPIEDEAFRHRFRVIDFTLL